VLFSYSPIGYQDNWLHDTIMQMLASDFMRIDLGKKPSGWPTCIPAARRDDLKSRRSLRDSRVVLLKAYLVLDPAERTLVTDAITQQNAIPQLFGANTPCMSLTDLPEISREPIKKFFECAFGLLTGLGLRDDNYKLVYDALDYKICAFCGVEILDAPEQKRESLDHYLPIAIYPFAGVDFRNLSPMGTKCNSRYKLKQDIIIEPATGNRRLCNDPYNSPALTLSLVDSEPFFGNRVKLSNCPKWVVNWQGGDPAKLKTWEDVFAISSRYVASSLDPNFRDWIDHFCQWAKRRAGSADTRLALRESLLEFAEVVVPEGLSDSSFLKRATIQMLAHRCDESEQGSRVFEWLKGQIDENRSLAA